MRVYYNNNCISTTSSIREELTSFVTAVQFLSPSYEISNTPLTFLDLKISLEGNGLGATVYHKPTESHSCFSPSFKVRSSFQTNDQPGTFKCTHSQYKTLSFIHTVKKMSGSKRSLKNHWSLITSRVPPRMSSTAKLAPIAKSCTLVKQEDD